MLRGEYQEVLDLAVTFKSPEWRAAHAARDAEHRGLTGDARDQRLAQAQAEMAGPYEVELMVTTWDRRENDLDRGQKSVWRVVLVDEQGREIEPIEIVKDAGRRSSLRSEFPALGDFADGVRRAVPAHAAAARPVGAGRCGCGSAASAAASRSPGTRPDHFLGGCLRPNTRSQNFGGS